MFWIETWEFMETSLTRQPLEYRDSYKATNAIKNFSCSMGLLFKLTVVDSSACHLGAHASRSRHQTISSLRSGSTVW